MVSLMGTTGVHSPDTLSIWFINENVQEVNQEKVIFLFAVMHSISMRGLFCV